MSAASALTTASSLHDALKHTILLADRLHKTGTEAAESSTPECAEIAAQAATIAGNLRSVHRVAGQQGGVYEVPMRRVLVEVERNLEKGLGLVKRQGGGRSAGFLVRKVFSMSVVADFKKVSSLLESSIADLSWLLSIYESDVPNLGLPPFVQHYEPILAWVWSHIAMLEPVRDMKARIGSANDLAQLAMNARNKQLIVEQGAVPRLLKLLKDGGVNGSVEAQVAASNALLNVVYCKESVKVIANEGGISLIAGVLGESVMKVQVVVAKLVTRMAEEDQVVREEFGKVNVMKPLVSCLLLDLALDHYAVEGGGKASWQSLVQINKELGSKNGMHPNHHDYHKVYSSASLVDGSSRGSNGRKERENEAPEVKYLLKTNCALALWRLCAGSLLNSRKIAEGNWLLFLAKIIENENGELRLNCLMTVMEIATVAETNPELRKAAWKPSLVPAKAVLDQLLRVIKEEDDPVLQIPAIKAIGCLARTFPAKETRILAPLVAQLGNSDSNVATEAAIALGKFVCPGNFNHVEHSNAIIEFKGVQLLMKMLKVNERGRFHGFVLLCHLSVNVGSSKELHEARALSIIEGAARYCVAQNPDVKDLFAGAIQSLAIYQATVHPHGHSYAIV
ncbi:hypothetical protein Drorol1_Dr00012419 [Drosera rotundifolia]